MNQQKITSESAYWSKLGTMPNQARKGVNQLDVSQISSNCIPSVNGHYWNVAIKNVSEMRVIYTLRTKGVTKALRFGKVSV